MIQIGKINNLQVTEKTDFGFYLDGAELGPILLPNGLEPEGCQVGDSVEAFVTYDSEDRLMATTETPKVMVGEISVLKVVSVDQIGAYLDWGLKKDLFLPFREQTRELRPGMDVIVAAYVDNTNRIASSMRIDKYFKPLGADYEVNEEVQLYVYAKSDISYKCVINQKHLGILYQNEVFKPLKYGQQIKGYIKKMREDGKIDLILQQQGYSGIDSLEQKILDVLDSKGGQLPIDDKTSAQIIYDLFGVSKKKYKMALGGLYKKRLIAIEADGIRLNKSK